MLFMYYLTTSTSARKMVKDLNNLGIPFRMRYDRINDEYRFYGRKADGRWFDELFNKYCYE